MQRMDKVGYLHVISTFGEELFSKGNKFAPNERKFFPFRVESFSEGSKDHFDRVLP